MNKERLLKLAEHLESGKLGHKEFYFGNYNVGEFDGRGCGTSGCAIGECPIVFKEWKFDDNGTPVVGKSQTAESSGTKFFNISISEYEHLFYPFSQNVEMYGGNTLGYSATKEQVASNIRAFVAKMESEA